jgi:acyl-coenzyme A thioesterase 13
MGDLSGYKTLEGADPAEDYIGPFYYKALDSGFDFAFKATQNHCNMTGIVHGGVLMTFADYCLCMVATDAYVEDCVTVSFNSEFISAGELDHIINGAARVTLKTGSLVFVRGEITQGEQILMTFSAVAKRLRKKT